MTAVIPEQPKIGPPAWVLLEQHRPDLIRLARARGCGQEDAEDLASEALLRAAAFRDLDPDRAGAFLNTVLQRLVVDKHRQEQRHQRLFARVAERGVVTSHEDAVCDRHDASVALARLADLPQTERDVLVARAQGVPVASIASRLHLSPKTVEGAYTRARGRVRRMLIASVTGIGVTLCGLKRHSAKLATTAVVPAAFLLLPGTVGPQATDVARTPATTTAETSVVHPASSVSSRAPLPQRAPSRLPGATDRAHARVGAVTSGPPVAVEVPHGAMHDQDETLLESVVRCVHERPRITTETIGCAPKH